MKKSCDRGLKNILRMHVKKINCSEWEQVLVPTRYISSNKFHKYVLTCILSSVSKLTSLPLGFYHILVFNNGYVFLPHSKFKLFFFFSEFKVLIAYISVIKFVLMVSLEVCLILNKVMSFVFSVRAIVALNLHSYGSGRNPWGNLTPEYLEKVYSFL